MDYEKLHKDTITKLQQMVNSGKITVEVARGICADFIPESEDEMIRRELIERFSHIKGIDWYGLPIKDILAWLEKQVEQKSANKIEPKFKVGDIIECGLSTLEVGFIDYNKCLYVLRTGEKLVVNCISFSEQDEWSLLYRHKFKVGDIVKRLDDGLEAIVTNVYGDGTITVKCEDWEDTFLETGWEPVEQKPAEDDDMEYACQSPENYTRRELMIYNLGIINGKKMFEDNIKEDQQKPAWSEEDEKRLNSICAWVKDYPRLANFRDEFYEKANKDVDWLKSLRPQPKQEWSEEDEATFTVIGSLILDNFSAEDASKTLTWLHSLTPHPQWKPSDEQMEALDNALSLAKNCGEKSAFHLRKLYEQLKKL